MEIYDKKVNSERILRLFNKLVSFDSESFKEKNIAEYIKFILTDLGLTVSEDSASAKLQEEDGTRIGAANNIYAYLKGNGDPRLFSSHLDTVSPGNGKRAVLHEDGRITSDGTTVLGADDVSGLVSVIEALTVIKEEGLPHPDIEVLFTVAEEPYCSGSRFIEYDRLHSKEGYVLDLTGDVGTAAVEAPAIISFSITVHGKAAHAGFEPENGINALNIAASALSRIKTGWVSDGLSVNFGTINGGKGRNIVPEEIAIEGEIRGKDRTKAMQTLNSIECIFEEEGARRGGNVRTSYEIKIPAYSVDTGSKTVQRFLKAASETGCKKPGCVGTFGGSDANRLNENGITAIVIACGMQKSHSREEYTSVSELTESSELTLRLMTSE